MALKGRQVRQLRSLAHHLEPVIIIGKADREAAEELAERCHAELVQVIGRRFVLYRETSREGVEKIQLV